METEIVEPLKRVLALAALFAASAQVLVACDDADPDADGGADGAISANDGGADGPSADAVSDPNDRYATARQLCVSLTNEYRARAGVAAMLRNAAREPCLDDESKNDSIAGIPHNSLGACGEIAQNQCEGQGYTADELITVCLEDMYNEGPGPGLAHAHYEQMMNAAFGQVACGFYDNPSTGGLWIVQDFYQ